MAGAVNICDRLGECQSDQQGRRWKAGVLYGRCVKANAPARLVKDVGAVVGPTNDYYSVPQLLL